MTQASGGDIEQITRKIRSFRDVAELMGYYAIVFEKKRIAQEEEKARRAAGIEDTCVVNVFRMQVPAQVMPVGLGEAIAGPSTGTLCEMPMSEKAIPVGGDAEAGSSSGAGTSSSRTSPSWDEKEEVGSKSILETTSDEEDEPIEKVERKRTSGTSVKPAGSKRLRSMRELKSERTMPWTRERDQDIALLGGLRSMKVETFRRKVEKMVCVQESR